VPSISSLLIIDDEPDVRKALIDIFKHEGVSHICDVPSAEAGFEMLKKEPFSLIICDYRLPGVSGVVFMGKLRLQGDRTPILLITGAPDKDPAFQAASQMRVDFLAKPFTIPALLSVVESLMERSV
jgi:DNA-binding NtrC family response regulator